MNRKLKLAGVDTLIEHIDKEELETKRIMSDRRSYSRFVCQSLDHKEWFESKRKSSTVSEKPHSKKRQSHA